MDAAQPRWRSAASRRTLARFRVLRIYDAIDYDFARSFGKPDTSHPMRSRIFDDAVQRWRAKHPDGTVVELGAGLETPFSRVDNGRVHWLCVDVPEAIAVRERFLPASDRCLHLQKSVLDLSWPPVSERVVAEIGCSLWGETEMICGVRSCKLQWR